MTDFLSASDWAAVRITLLLALICVVVLLTIATPLAWWLAHSRGRVARMVEAVVALPLVLPPTVLGFYLLILLGPAGTIGSWWVRLTGDTLVFSFAGLVVATCVHSLPFAVQPLQNAFEAVGKRPLDAAATLGAGPLAVFFKVLVPLALRGYVTAAVLTFAHAIGEFGVLLMVGGNIPGRTRVVSIAIFEHVERFDYAAAHRLAAAVIIFALAVLLATYTLNRRLAPRVLR